jgi:hypothetical protein
MGLPTILLDRQTAQAFESILNDLSIATREISREVINSKTTVELECCQQEEMLRVLVCYDGENVFVVLLTNHANASGDLAKQIRAAFVLPQTE